MTDKREIGRQIMSEVLGEAIFDQLQASTNDFNAPLRRFSEECCFGTVWSRPGLERKVRSMLCLAMLTALNRQYEVRIHVNGALNNGCTVEEIQEVLLHTIPYCGLPASVDSFRTVGEVLRERGML